MPEWKEEIRQRLAEMKLEPTREAEIVEELSQHLDNRYQELLAAGVRDHEAYRGALAELGDNRLLTQELRRVGCTIKYEPVVLGARRRNMLGDLRQDLRYGLRMLLKAPGFTAVALLSVALAVGANTALFSLVDAVLLRMLPVKNPEELVLFKWVSAPGPPPALTGDFFIDENGQGTSTSFSYNAFERFRAHNQTLEDVFAFVPLQLNVSAGGQAEIASAQFVSGGYYSGLGVQTLLGRAIAESDDQAAASPVAVISRRYWQRRFGSDTTVVGKTISLNNTAFTIIGVTPPEFHGTMHVGRSHDLSIPLAMEPLVRPGGTQESLLRKPWAWWLPMMGRLKPGVSAEDARANLEGVFHQSVLDDWAMAPAQGKSNEPREVPRLKVVSGSQGFTELREAYSQPLRVLMVVVGLVLLIACANVANLLLARDATRQKELAVRLALGASRSRLVRQLLTESVLLALCGAALGVVFAYWGKDLLLALRPWGGGELALDLKLDLRVLSFTTAVSLLTGILFGLAPALRMTRIDLTPAIKEGAQSLSGGSRSLLNKALIVAQVAMSLLLLVGAGLFIRTLGNLQKIDVGFNREGVLLFRVDPQLSGYKSEQLPNLYQRMIERIEAVPPVRSATFSDHALLSGSGSTRGLTVLGETPQAGQDNRVQRLQVRSNFLETMEIPLLQGRNLTEQDNANAPKAALVNQTLAQRFFPNEDPIGKRFLFGASPNPNAAPDPKKLIEIVGVVRDAKYFGLRQQTPATVYVPGAQNPSALGQMVFEVRTTGDPLALVPAIREAVRQVDKNLPLHRFITQRGQAEEKLAQERLFARLTTFFGLLALALVSIGLYGVMAYSVAQRTREIGIRVALGAQSGAVLRMVLRESFRLALIGVVIGLPAALVATRWISGQLYGLAPNDPPTIATVTLLMLAVTTFAGYLPARRAAEVEPLVALRYE